MLGIIVLVIASWVILYFLLNTNIEAIGVKPSARRMLFMTGGFLLSLALCAISQIIKSYLDTSQWQLNSNILLPDLFAAIWFDIKSVVTEELLFRGALLFILIKRIGSVKAVALTAVAFGIYHWFTFGILGNIIPMVFIFIGTGLMGFALSYAFLKSNSILLPIGIHLGWNITQNTIFSKGPLGDLILISSGSQPMSDSASLFSYFISMVFPPIVIFISTRWFFRKTTSQ